MSGIPPQQQKQIGAIPQGGQSQNYAPAANLVNQSGQYMNHSQPPAPPVIGQDVNSNGPQSPFKPQVPTQSNPSPSHQYITNNSNNAYSRNSSPSINVAVPNSSIQFSPQPNSYQQSLPPSSSAMPYLQTSLPSSSPNNRPLMSQQSLPPSVMRPPTSVPLNYPSVSGQNSYPSHLSTSQQLPMAPPVSNPGLHKSLINQPHTMNQPPISSAYGQYTPPISGPQQSLPNLIQHQMQPLPPRQINSNMPPLMSTSQPPQSIQYPVNGSASSIGSLPTPPLNPTSQPMNRNNPPINNPPISSNRYPQQTSQPGITPPHPGQPPMPNRYPPNPGPPQPYPTQAYQQPGLQSQPPPCTSQPQFQGSQPQFQPYQTNGPQQLTQQMGQLSVSQAGFSQMWGHQMVDLLQTRNVLPEHKVEPPPIRLTHQFAESVNCSPDIFRCTVNRIPETNALLQKSRLPLGILIHPFKDLDHLPVIQCSAIVRCRACRTYINPFVFFVDSKRWKCNLCFRVNDLPDEFQYDPVSKSYGDPTRRPEIKSATIEFIAPAEYMLRPPQPAVYLFLLDVSQIARESGYIKEFCETLSKNIDRLPGDARTQVGFICYDAAVHFYCLGEGLTRPREMTVIDIEDVFLPSPSALLVNVGERKEMIMDLLESLPTRHSGPGVPNSALGAALQAAYKLMSATGGRISVFQTSLPNVGPGGLTSREDPNARSSKEVNHLNPSTDFYKRLALDCSGMQVAVDLFLLNSQYADLATLSGISKFSGGSIYHIPLYKSARSWQSSQFVRMLTRYLSRKIGFEAVMRVRCTRGVTIHTFHGNFFVRSTDLLSLPNVSPDVGYGMQLTIEESLSDLQNICFQAALLYTSSKGERRIRVHTMCLPIANNLTDVLHSADQQCIIGMLTKMAVDRSLSSSLGDAREALTNVALDALGAFRMSLNLPAGSSPGGLAAPAALRLLPLYLLAALKHPAFRVGTSTRLDDRVAAMCAMKSLPLACLLRTLYPDLYPLHDLSSHLPQPPPPPTHNGETDAEEEEIAPDPPRLHLSAEKINSNGAYLLDDGDTFIIYVGHAVDRTYLQDTFGVTDPRALPERELPCLDTEQNILLHAFVEKLNDDRPYAANIIILSDSSPNRLLFTERLVDDRVESSFSYYEFLQHIKTQIK